MQEGKFAGITIFNPETVRERANMKVGEHGLSPVGIPYVLVGGQVIIDGGRANTDLRPGAPIRYAPITEGEIDLDLNDKQYPWHADLPDPE